MKQRIQLFGAIALLALIVGAFLLPSTPAQAASLANTIYQRVLPAETLTSNTKTIIAEFPFRVTRRGILHFTTSQMANLGNYKDPNYGGFLSVVALLDGNDLSYTFDEQAGGRSILTQIGIDAKTTVVPGRHYLILYYFPYYSPTGPQPEMCSSPCHFPMLTHGKLWLSAPGLHV